MTAYAGTDELARILGIQRSITAAQGTAVERVLDAAAYEINQECLGAGTEFFGTPYPALAVEVNLQRAADLWYDEAAKNGWIGFGEAGPVRSSLNSWEHYAFKLAPLKETWGIG